MTPFHRTLSPVTRALSWALAVCAVLSLACGGEEPGPGNPSETLAISPALRTVEPGSTVQFAAKLGQQAADVVWSASAGVIDASGRFTAPEHGVSSTITAVLSTDASVTASLSVLSKDTRPPALVATAPLADATDVGVMSAIQVEFDENLDPASAASARVSLEPQERAEMTNGSLQVRIQERTVTVTSARPMQRGSEITLQLSGLEDGAGNEAPATTLRFRTRAGTLVSQDLTGTVRFTKDGSPYVFDPDKVIHLTASSTLEVEAGAVVMGGLVDDGQSTLRALGTAEEPVTFYNGWLRGSATSSTHTFQYARFHVFNPAYFSSAPTGALATYEHCVIDWLGSPLAFYGDVYLGAGSMTDCHLKSPRISLYGNGATFRRNFLEGQQVILGPSHFNASVFENNHLKGGKLYIAPQGTSARVRGNSFVGLTTQVSQLTLGGNDGRSGGTFDFTGNYWGTPVRGEIDAMILDSADDSAANYTLHWEPFLTAPDANTPVTPPAL